MPPEALAQQPGWHSGSWPSRCSLGASPSPGLRQEGIPALPCLTAVRRPRLGTDGQHHPLVTFYLEEAARPLRTAPGPSPGGRTGPAAGLSTPRTARPQGRGPACPRSPRAGAVYIRRVRRHQPAPRSGGPGEELRVRHSRRPGAAQAPARRRDGAARSGRIPPTPPRRDGARVHRGSPACTGRAAALLTAGKPHPDPQGPRDPSPSHTTARFKGSGTLDLPRTGPTLTTHLPFTPGLSPPPLTPPCPPAEDGAPRLGPAPRTHPRPAGPGGAGGSGAARADAGLEPGTAPTRPGPTIYRIRRGRSQRAFRPITARASACRGGHDGAL